VSKEKGKRNKTQLSDVDVKTLVNSIDQSFEDKVASLRVLVRHDPDRINSALSRLIEKKPTGKL